MADEEMQVAVAPVETVAEVSHPHRRRAPTPHSTSTPRPVSPIPLSPNVIDRAQTVTRESNKCLASLY
jgi:hypothetical protein